MTQIEKCRISNITGIYPPKLLWLNINSMKILMIGTGNIGLISALCLAEKGHEVFCIDTDQTKINKLIEGQSTLFEPGLDELLKKQLSAQKIHFSTKIEDYIHQADIIFLAVGTPNHSDGRIDLSAIHQAVEKIAQLSSAKTIIIRSTVPPKTNLKLSEQYKSLSFISSPEFLREGSAIDDELHPDRIIIGSDNPEHLELFKKIFINFEIDENKFIQMDSTTAELTKYAANIFLAARISLINEFSRICEKTGADIQTLKLGLSLDPRIGKEFLNSGLGYGGSCFPKDIDALLSHATELKENLKITQAVKETNDLQIENFAKKIITKLSGKKTISIWGASFKPDTDDLREAPALKLMDLLLKEGLKIKVYDPKAGLSLQKIFLGNSSVCVSESSYAALEKSDALVIATEWSEFQQCDLSKVKSLLNNPIIFDGRNIFSPHKMKDLGFNYHSIGRAQ